MAGLLKRLEEKGSGILREPAGPWQKPAGEGDGGVGVAGLTPEKLIKHVQVRLLETDSSLVERARRDSLERLRLRETIATMLARDHLAVHKMSREVLAEDIANEIAGYGPIEPYVQDETISEIMVNGPNEVFVERSGRLERTPSSFRGQEHLEELISRIIAPLGRRLDQASPFVDARLPDGSRVHAVIPPLVLNGPVLTIRKFGRRKLSAEDLVQIGTWNQRIADFVKMCVRARANIIVGGGTGSGKTTTLNVLSSFIPPGRERIITIEDIAELTLAHEHVISMEARPPNIEGKGEVTLRQLLRNALRMRPDRLVIGEVRGAEAFELLQALNTGHEGCMSTVHANSPLDTLRRLENMVLMAATGLPHAAVREQIQAAVDMVLFQARLQDGSRKTLSVALVDKECEMKEGRLSQYVLEEVFRYRQGGEFWEKPGLALPNHLTEKLTLAEPDWPQNPDQGAKGGGES